MASRCPRPMRNTSVPPHRARAEKSSGRPSGVSAVWPVMTWKLRLKPLCVTGMPAPGGDSHGRGDTRDLLTGDPRPVQGQQLLPAPAKDEGVAPLQPDHRLSLLGQGNEGGGDVPLGGGVLPAPLAQIAPLRLQRSQVQQS